MGERLLVDSKTVAKYDSDAESFIADWMSQPPVMLRRLIINHFTPKSKILDIGSGSGRDVAWMTEAQFNAEGVDASKGLLAAARLKYPHAVFRYDTLPALANTLSAAYDHALCSAVLMHLPRGEIPAAVANIVRVVGCGGKIICSVRPSRELTEREADDRLFTDINLDDLAAMFRANSCNVLDAQSTFAAGTDRIWHTLVLEKISS
jgi:2-polyprenyl-3-methyl-5-hydroxy-6-metoxy-1,4-benzoquinol methylase